jgi:hypothetical protein
MDPKKVHTLCVCLTPENKHLNRSQLPHVAAR